MPSLRSVALIEEETEIVLNLLNEILEDDMSRTWHKEKESHKRGSKAFSSHCANHGTCGWCQGNRHHKFERTAKQFHEDEYVSLATSNINDEIFEYDDSYWEDTLDNEWEDYQIHDGDLKIISYLDDYEKMQYNMFCDNLED